MNLVKDLFVLLAQKNQTLALAESCTGGGLAHAITTEAGISQVFVGGVIAYANEAKIKLLNVDPAAIEQHGAVSEQVAMEMAQNCRTIFDATWALSTTGIAGPSGGSADKPVGTVWIAISGPNVLEAHKFIFSDLSRLEHRKICISTALNLALKFHR